MEERQVLSPEHQEEIRVIKRLFNNKLFVAVSSIVVTGLVSWITIAADYSNKVEQVIQQGDDKAKVDSINFAYLKQKNEDLILYMQTANQAIINNNINYERLQVQYDYIESELQDIKERLNKQK